MKPIGGKSHSFASGPSPSISLTAGVRLNSFTHFLLNINNYVDGDESEIVVIARTSIEEGIFGLWMKVFEAMNPVITSSYLREWIEKVTVLVLPLPLDPTFQSLVLLLQLQGLAWPFNP